MDRHRTRPEASPVPLHETACAQHISALREELRVFAVSLGLELICGDEPQRCRVDAVAQAGRFRAVVEDVAEARVAELAADLDADHAVRRVALLDDRAGDERLPEARPARA